MRTPLLAIVLATVCLSMTGCGGCTTTEADMRRHARVRFPDELESAPSPADNKQAAAAKPGAAAQDEKGANRGANQGAGKTAKTAGSAKPGKVEAAGPGSESTAGAKGAAKSNKPKETPVLVAFAPEPALPETSPVTVVVQNPRPPEPLNQHEARTRTVKNLKRIGKAIQDYIERYGQFPPRAIRNDTGDFGLSWRVAILPELGYEELYRQFRLFEAWDSPHNKQLLDQIPPEFQSPERFDTSTNYLAVAAPGSVFMEPQPINPKAIWDGPANTVLVVEADDTHAVAWSRPADLVVSGSNALKGLGTLRGDGFLCVLADGNVRRAPPTTSAMHFIALFTFQGEESMRADAILKEPTLVAPAIGNALAIDAAGGDAPAEGPGAHPGTAPPAAGSPLELPPTGPPPVPKLAVPDEIDLAKARALLKDLYGEELKKNPKPEDKAKVVQKMLATAGAMENSPADYYELLRIVRDVGSTCGDVNSALQAIEHLETKFQIDTLAMRLKSLDELAKFAKDKKVADTLSDMAKDVFILCIDKDDYDAAQTVSDHLLALARSSGDRAEAQRATQTKTALAAARKAYTQVPIALKRLEENPNDGPANETVGKYLCLVKGRWQVGLPYLLRGDDLRLRLLATIDMMTDRKPKETVSLADQYWTLADDYHQPQTRSLQLRAAFLYKIAVTQVGEGLEKSKAKKRMDEADLQYGKFEVQRAITRMVSDANLTALIATPKDTE